VAKALNARRDHTLAFTPKLGFWNSAPLCWLDLSARRLRAPLRLCIAGYHMLCASTQPERSSVHMCCHAHALMLPGALPHGCPCPA